MKKAILEKLQLFVENTDKCKIKFMGDYKKFNSLFDNMISGEGMIGTANYLVLWKKSELEELNDDYAVSEFLSDTILIGSNGGDTAYGINIKGQFIEVPFIGMDEDEVKIVANTFDEFIDYLWCEK